MLLFTHVHPWLHMATPEAASHTSHLVTTAVSNLVSQPQCLPATVSPARPKPTVAVLVQCELCGKQYKEEVAQRLEPLLQGRRPRHSRSRTVRVVNANGDTVLAVEAAEEEEEEQPRPRISWTRFW